MTPLVNQFDDIRARRDELAAERLAATAGEKLTFATAAERVAAMRVALARHGLVIERPDSS